VFLPARSKTTAAKPEGNDMKQKQAVFVGAIVVFDE